MKWLLLLFIFSLNVFSREIFMLESGIYRQVAPVLVELCDQKLRSVVDDNRIVKGIYVEYIGMCGSQGPYYYFCNNDVLNECYNIGHRFKVLDHNYYQWTNESSSSSGYMQL